MLLQYFYSKFACQRLSWGMLWKKSPSLCLFTRTVISLVISPISPSLVNKIQKFTAASTKEEIHHFSAECHGLRHGGVDSHPGLFTLICKPPQGTMEAATWWSLQLVPNWMLFTHWLHLKILPIKQNQQQGMGLAESNTHRDCTWLILDDADIKNLHQHPCVYNF